MRAYDNKAESGFGPSRQLPLAIAIAIALVPYSIQLSAAVASPVALRHCRFCRFFWMSVNHLASMTNHDGCSRPGLVLALASHCGWHFDISLGGNEVHGAAQLHLQPPRHLQQHHLSVRQRFEARNKYPIMQLE
ncbi:Hypothetical predicted protein [Drosophila guanche]|uniref:Uncharacterized protein n=1 Tax=Drosophila guanche TaxID=7266 RepID=A0A3B0KK12_DROGU|nr:Hypothetical predicted protein [Drosophila guanche]